MKKLIIRRKARKEQNQSRNNKESELKISKLVTKTLISELLDSIDIESSFY